ncbi:MAG: hypothetical protein EB072_09385, partial [Betaproteobacteria bacterium]|nr:hypothetical protein [Betaproteobacteria bacterium]
MAIKNLIFDLGGVLFDWRPREFLAELLEDCCPDAAFECFFQNYESSADWLMLDKGDCTSFELADRIARRFRDKAETQLRLKRYADAITIHQLLEALFLKLQPNKDARSWLCDLAAAHRESMRFFYLSNMPNIFASRIVKEQKIFECFEQGIFSCDVNLIKPDQRIFKLAQQRFSIEDPSTILFLDDSKQNVAAAIDAKWQAIHFRSFAEAKNAFEKLISSNAQRKDKSPLVARSVHPFQSGNNPGTNQPSIRSFVIRRGRMGSGQKRALESLGERYMIPKAAIPSGLQKFDDQPDPIDSWWDVEHRRKPLVVDIGFGMGDALASMAAQDPSHRYLGIEVHPPGVGSLLQRIHD